MAEPAIPAPLRDFLRLHRSGEYWESHEVLEAPWREHGSAFYQGLILYASAWVHWTRGNAHGVDAQLRKARERLDGYPDRYLGVDVAAVRKHCHDVRAAVASESDWVDRVRPLDLEVDPSLIRGDEPELDPGLRGTGSAPDAPIDG